MTDLLDVRLIHLLDAGVSDPMHRPWISRHTCWTSVNFRDLDLSKAFEFWIYCGARLSRDRLVSARVASVETLALLCGSATPF